MPPACLPAHYAALCLPAQRLCCLPACLPAAGECGAQRRCRVGGECDRHPRNARPGGCAFHPGLMALLDPQQVCSARVNGPMLAKSARTYALARRPALRGPCPLLLGTAGLLVAALVCQPLLCGAAPRRRLACPSPSVPAPRVHPQPCPGIPGLLPLTSCTGGCLHTGAAAHSAPPNPNPTPTAPTHTPHTHSHTQTRTPTLAHLHTRRRAHRAAGHLEPAVERRQPGRGGGDQRPRGSGV